MAEGWRHWWLDRPWQVWEAPAALTRDDLAWLDEHLRLAGLAPITSDVAAIFTTGVFKTGIPDDLYKKVRSSYGPLVTWRNLAP